MTGQYDDTNRGVLFKNERKTKDSQPDYNGKGNFGGQEFEIAGWIKEAKTSGKKFISFSFQPPRDAANQEPRVAAEQQSQEEETPF